MSDTNAIQVIGDYVRIERSGAIAKVIFDRDDSLNAMSRQMMLELKAAAETLADDTDCASIILTGSTVFSGGADLKDPALRARDSMTLLEEREAVKLGPAMCDAWAKLEQITIAAIEGFCIGGGLALAVSCDHRIMSKGAHLRLPEIPLGMNMSWRSIPRIVGLIGPSRTKELVILGRKVDATKALAWGLVDQLSAPDKALETAQDMASAYCTVPPVPARMAKEAIDACAQPLGYATSFMDRDQFLLTRRSSDHAEAAKAFIEKRPPKFRGD